MRARRWIRALDCSWGFLLLAALGACFTGEAPWYKAAVVLAPFSAYLLSRSIVLSPGQRQPVAGDGSSMSPFRVREGRTA